MVDKQKEIQNEIKNEIELIESERYNSKDPIVEIKEPKNPHHVIVKLLTSERTGAPLKLEKDILYPAEDLAKRNFSIGVSTLNSWQFRKSKDYLNDAANKAFNPILQQRVNLYKQFNKLLESIIKSTPEKSVKRTQSLFKDIIDSIKKYDKFSDNERLYYTRAVDSHYDFATQLDSDNIEIQTQQLLARCTISLTNKEYLAAYIWLYKIYLLNREMFDTIAGTDEILARAVTNLRTYLEIETGLKDNIDDLPKMASSFDLQTIFIDHLTEIFDTEFLETTKENLSFKQFRENQ